MLLQEIKQIKSSKRDLRKFGLTVGSALLILGGILFWYQKPSFPYILGGAGVLLLSGLIFPILLLPVQKLWMTFAVVMGWFMSRLILGVVYLFVFSLIGLFSKLAGKQFLELKWDHHQSSYWHFRDRKAFDPQACEKQF